MNENQVPPIAPKVFHNRSQSLRSILVRSTDLNHIQVSPYRKDRFLKPDQTPVQSKTPTKSPKSPRFHTPNNSQAQNECMIFTTPNKLFHKKLVLKEEQQLDAPDLCIELPSQVFSFDSSERFALALGVSVYIWESGEVTLLTEAPDRITCLAFCNSYLILSYRGIVEIWDLTLNSLIRNLPSHSGTCCCLAICESRIASGGTDGIIHITDISPQIPQKTINVKMGEICSLAWSPDGTFLASATSNGHIGIWGDKRPHFFQHGNHSNQIAWLNNDIIAAGDNSEFGELKLFSMHNSLINRETSILTGYPISDLKNSSKFGLFVAHTNSPNSFELYSHDLKKLKKEDKGSVVNLTISPDESQLAICVTDEFVIMYSLNEGFSQTEKKTKSATIGFTLR